MVVAHSSHFRSFGKVVRHIICITRLHDSLKKKDELHTSILEICFMDPPSFDDAFFSRLTLEPLTREWLPKVQELQVGKRKTKGFLHSLFFVADSCLQPTLTQALALALTLALT